VGYVRAPENERRQLMAIFHSRGSVWYGAAAGAPSASTLRVKGVAFSANQIIVRDGKGHKNRVTLLPAAVKASPERKYPNTDRAWTWQTVFPATRTYVDRLTRRQRRPLHDIWTVQTAARPQRREHHDDLHARPEPGPGGGTEPGGPDVRTMRRMTCGRERRAG
jgi:hypothetical protein